MPSASVPLLVHRILELGMALLVCLYFLFAFGGSTDRVTMYRCPLVSSIDRGVAMANCKGTFRLQTRPLLSLDVARPDRRTKHGVVCEWLHLAADDIQFSPRVYFLSLRTELQRAFNLRLQPQPFMLSPSLQRLISSQGFAGLKPRLDTRPFE